MEVLVSCTGCTGSRRPFDSPYLPKRSSMIGNLNSSNRKKTVVRRRSYSEDTNKFWREEREDGAVYNVYLKKVVYNSFPEDAINDDSSKLAWETLKVRQVQAGTLEKLVHALLQEDGQLDSTYVNVFLATYRSFTSTKEVLDLLFTRYVQLADIKMKNELREIHRRSLRSVIHIWLDSYAEDFREPTEFPCLNAILKFAQDNFKDGDLEHRLRHKIEKYRKEDEQLKIASASHLKGLFPSPRDTEKAKSCTFMGMDNQDFAEQLTYIDAYLFKKVIPHYCLGGIWSKRIKKKERDSQTIMATIDQFNAVSYRVISTILTMPTHKSSHRAKAIMKWIDIAQELRRAKNFSSLKAIISGLQSTPIFRLSKTWDAVPKSYKETFEDLSQIFSSEDNEFTSRILLIQEGTAKFAGTESGGTLKRRTSLRRKSWSTTGTVQGTVPYLGTFLRDLTMIDTAIPEITEEGLINFNKKRKEFEIIAQIKLLQSAANTYSIEPDMTFHAWFDSLEVYTDRQSHELSCQIEPTPVKSSTLKKKPSFSLSSLTRRSSAECLAVPVSPYNSAEDRMSVSSANSSSPSPKSKRPIQHSISLNSLESPDPKSCDTCVIRVTMSHDNNEDTSIYKSIMLSNRDHTTSVIRRVLEKYDIEDDSDTFCIAQKLPEGELLLPDKCNVYYAMNNSVELNFVVRKKQTEVPIKSKKSFSRFKSPRKPSVS